jgi:hypothetical protein
VQLAVAVQNEEQKKFVSYVFRVVTSSGFLGRYQCFGGTLPKSSTLKLSNMRFGVLAALKKSLLVFSGVTLCGLVGRYQRFRETYCIYCEG